MSHQKTKTTLRRYRALCFWVLVIELIVIAVLLFLPMLREIAEQAVYIPPAPVGDREPISLQSIEFTEDQFIVYALTEITVPSATITYTDTLRLVNRRYHCSEEEPWSLKQFRDYDLKVSRFIIDDLEALIADVKENAEEPMYIISSYRTADEQRALYRDNPEIAAPVGASEHQTGLALDVYSPQKAHYQFLTSDAGVYLNLNCWKHGFIIRYPADKEGITKIPYEPWHIRYVGLPHAAVIYHNNWSLEEYILEQLQPNVFYAVQYDQITYIICRQSPQDGALRIPQELTEITVSEDNTGYCIITGRL